MEKEKQTTEQKTDEQAKPKKSVNMKVFLIGIPLFVVQLAAVYYVTANYLVGNVQTAEQKPEEKVQEETPSAAELGQHIFLIEDIIVNPSGTDGKRLLLTSIGIDLKNEESKQEIKEKEVIVKDVIISTLSSKSWDQLTSSNFKDSMKVEISGKIQKLIPAAKINTIYLSKYITQ